MIGARLLGRMQLPNFGLLPRAPFEIHIFARFVRGSRRDDALVQTFCSSARRCGAPGFRLQQVRDGLHFAPPLPAVNSNPRPLLRRRPSKLIQMLPLSREP